MSVRHGFSLAASFDFRSSLLFACLGDEISFHTSVLEIRSLALILFCIYSLKFLMRNLLAIYFVLSFANRLWLDLVSQ